MKVLVTGATGFIGSSVAAALVRKGHQVRVGIRRESDLGWLERLDAERVEWDLRTPSSAAVLTRGVEAVVHAAGVKHATDRDSFLRVNVDGSRALAEAAATSGVQRFIQISSVAARGPDQAQAPGDAPVSWYGLSKLLAERAVRDATEGTCTACVALRPTAVYGPRDKASLPMFRAASHGVLPVPRARLRVQSLHVYDLVTAVEAALAGRGTFGPWLVANERSHDWEDVADAMRTAFDRSIRSIPVPRAVFVSAARAAGAWAALRRDAPRLDLRQAEDLAMFSYTGDTSPTMRALEWKPHMSVSDGIRTTVAWYRSQGWLP